MATTLRQITDRVHAIVTASAPAGVGVWRDRADAISRDEAPCVNQLWVDAPVQALSDEADQHTLELDLQLHVRAEPFTPAAEDLHEALHHPIVADAQLKALVESVRLVEQSAQRAEADLTAGVKTARYHLKYLLPKTSL